MNDADNHQYTRTELIRMLNECLNKTLGEIDKNNVFDKAKVSPKITGIAGDVIEQSVLGYPANSKQEPDLIVDGEEIELKTTGIRPSKSNQEQFEAKEPMSITAVSPNKIIHEEFEDSNFWHKARRLLLIYYLYAAKHTVEASRYADFPILGYEFHNFDDTEKKALEQDWKIVRNFIRNLQEAYINYEAEYPRISSELRPQLLLLDTAPKWPNPPRFRFKRSFVTSIVQSYFGEKLEQLPNEYISFVDIDAKCHELATQYGGKTIKELAKVFGLSELANKAIGERIAVKMFGGNNTKLGKIKLFNEAGVIGKTIVVTERDTRTEDMKLFPINFNELLDGDIDFSQSSFADFFFNHQLLCIVFRESSVSTKLEENVFVGFKRYSFSDSFIEHEVRAVWERMRKLIFENGLVDVIKYDKGGKPKLNKTGEISSAPNFPKSKDGPIFVRGGGSDSTNKPEIVNNIAMYRQYIWLKGKFIASELQKMPFL